MREITLDPSVMSHRSFELSTGNFVLSDEGKNYSRICIVNPNGQIIQCKVNSTIGSGVGQCNGLADVKVASNGDILVADCWNYRIQVLTSQLGYLGSITLPNHNLVMPVPIYLDDVNKRFFVSEFNDAGRLFVIGADNVTTR